VRCELIKPSALVTNVFLFEIDIFTNATFGNFYSSDLLIIWDFELAPELEEKTCF
jgi:hypothetical protein